MAIEIERGNPITNSVTERGAVTERRSLEASLKEKLQPPPLYKVILLNDDFTPMDFVTDLLKKLFHKNSDEAEQIMLNIHRQGRAVCGIYPFDIAETKQYQTLLSSQQQGHPLRCIIEADG